MESGKKTCIHIGMPKTASTLFQESLFERHPDIAYLGQAPVWREDSYADTPALAFTHYIGARDEALLTDACRVGLQQQAVEAQQSGRTAVWSSEGLAARPLAALDARRFHDWFGSCRIILFIREPLSFAESYYLQELGNFNLQTDRLPKWMQREWGRPPRLLSAEEWMETTLAPGKGRDTFFHYAETAQIYADVFGRENVKLFLFEQFVENPERVIWALSEFMGIDPKISQALIGTRRANPRWPEAQIQRLRRLERSALLSWIFRRMSPVNRRRMLELPRRSSAEGWRPEFSEHWKKRIDELTVPQNRMLKEQWNLPVEEYGYRT